LLGRRQILLGAAAAGISGRASAQTDSAGRFDVQKELSPSEQILHTTIRLTFDRGNGNFRTGTGFFFGFFPTDGGQVALAIVSNKHVFLGDDYINNPEYIDPSVSFLMSDAKGAPTNRSYSTTLLNTKDLLILHPTQDLAALMVSGHINKLRSSDINPFFINLLPGNIPDESSISQLTPLEGVLTAGYPGQIWDNVNNLPLFHRGSTASPINVDFQGRKEFLVDFTTWFGASGSPVFLYEEGVWYDRASKGYSLGGLRLNFVGVVFGVATQPIAGPLVISQAPTQLAPAASYSALSAIPTNIGACLKSSLVLDFETLLIQRRVAPPPNYKLRSGLK
jgi:hypothetical protein